VNNVRSGLYLLAAAFIVSGILLDMSYQHLTPNAKYVQGTVVDFQRPHRKQVYPIFEFTDDNGNKHRVVNPTQQGIVRFAAGDVVAIAYSHEDPDKARIDTPWFNHRWFMAALIVALTTIGGVVLRTRSPRDS
jgi:translation initiation factor IF-1